VDLIPQPKIDDKVGNILRTPMLEKAISIFHYNIPSDNCPTNMSALNFRRKSPSNLLNGETMKKGSIEIATLISLQLAPLVAPLWTNLVPYAQTSR
jgi:hypothetical protein